MGGQAVSRQQSKNRPEPEAADRLFVDRLFVDQEASGPFVFDDAVARVFPDMLKRSIPGYESLLELIAVLARRSVEPGTRVYDLGCSHGAVAFRIRESLPTTSAEIIAVDNSQAMIRRLESQIGEQQACRIEARCRDVTEVEIEQASLVVLNFTLQFVERERRDGLVESIADGLLPGGILVLSEKTEDSRGELDLFGDLHDSFRVENGYSRLELARKRQALENVLFTEPAESHHKRLERAGLTPLRWFQSLQFISWIAFKGEPRLKR